MNEKELTNYMNDKIVHLMAKVLKNTFRSPRETMFLLRLQKSLKKSMNKRFQLEKQGYHIPAFLISGIANSCNLCCKGCYAQNELSEKNKEKRVLTTNEWENIFEQAAHLGISFHLLAGGEPLLRKDVLSAAAYHGDTVFPIFTNGTLLDDFYLNLFDLHRNLVPILSIEGGREDTDIRRGSGIYDQVHEKMKLLHQLEIPFGVSITVTTQNLHTALDIDLIYYLQSIGCYFVFFIEYVPIDATTQNMAIGEKDRDLVRKQQEMLRDHFPEMLLLSFPGDERELGGCLAAGRGFFYINAYGEAEACPFSPYADCNLKENTVLEVLQSPFFKALRKEALFYDTQNDGGCTLFTKKQEVEKIYHKNSGETDGGTI